MMFELRWSPDVNIGNILTFIGLLATALGLMFTARQLRNGIRVQRAQFLLQTTERYFKDTDVRRLYYDIDYNRFELRFVNNEPHEFRRNSQDFKPFFGSEEERLLDTLLYTLDVIARVAELKAMDERESRLFAFQAARVFHNKQIAAYLDWLDKERVRFGGDVPSHEAARKLVNRIVPGRIP
jgi:hypothetical protein